MTTPIGEPDHSDRRKDNHVVDVAHDLGLEDTLDSFILDDLPFAADHWRELTGVPCLVRTCCYMGNKQLAYYCAAHALELGNISADVRAALNFEGALGRNSHGLTVSAVFNPAVFLPHDKFPPPHDQFLRVLRMQADAESPQKSQFVLFQLRPVHGGMHVGDPADNHHLRYMFKLASDPTAGRHRYLAIDIDNQEQVNAALTMCRKFDDSWVRDNERWLAAVERARPLLESPAHKRKLGDWYKDNGDMNLYWDSRGLPRRMSRERTKRESERRQLEALRVPPPAASGCAVQ